MAGPRVSGTAVLLGLSGMVLVVSAVRNASIEETLRAILRGQPVPGGPDELGARIGARIPLSTQPVQGGSALGGKAAAAAESYIGVPYIFGGETPAGWDCSGFVTWVLHRDLGLNLPSNFHTVAAQFYVWTGAVTVPRADCAPGDLVCWPSHIGIAVSNTEMVHAPGAGQKTRRQKIWSVPAPVIRRPKAYGVNEAVTSAREALR